MRPRNPKTAVAKLIACAALLWAPVVPALAGSATPSFPVNITLNSPAAGGAPAQPAATAPAGGICVNQALSRAAHATVTVVCTVNQFVNIAPAPGMPYLGTHGGAYRYLLTQAAFLPDDDVWEAGTGTVTTLQIVPRKHTRWDIAEIQISY